MLEIIVRSITMSTTFSAFRNVEILNVVRQDLSIYLQIQAVEQLHAFITTSKSTEDKGGNQSLLQIETLQIYLQVL